MARLGVQGDAQSSNEPSQGQPPKPLIPVEVQLMKMSSQAEHDLLAKMLGAIGLEMNSILLTQWEGQAPPAQGVHTLKLEGELHPSRLLADPSLKKKAWALLQKFQKDLS